MDGHSGRIMSYLPFFIWSCRVAVYFLTLCTLPKYHTGRSYCFDASLAPQPTDRPTPMPTHSGLVNLGDNGCSRGSCNACEGDCDSDEDCAGGLRCFSREKLEAVPGCSADGDGFDGECFSWCSYRWPCSSIHVGLDVSHLFVFSHDRYGF